MYLGTLRWGEALPAPLSPPEQTWALQGSYGARQGDQSCLWPCLRPCFGSQYIRGSHKLKWYSGTERECSPARIKTDADLVCWRSQGAGVSLLSSFPSSLPHLTVFHSPGLQYLKHSLACGGTSVRNGIEVSRPPRGQGGVRSDTSTSGSLQQPLRPTFPFSTLACSRWSLLWDQSWP